MVDLILWHYDCHLIGVVSQKLINIKSIAKQHKSRSQALHGLTHYSATIPTISKNRRKKKKRGKTPATSYYMVV